MSPASDIDQDLSSTVSVGSTSPAPDRVDSSMLGTSSPEAFPERQTSSIPAFPPSSTDSVPVDPPSPSPSPSPEQSSSRPIVTRSQQQQPSPITLAAAARSVKRRGSPELEPDSHVVDHLRPPVRRRLEDDTPV